MPNEQFFSYIVARTNYVLMRWWYVCFVLDQHTELNFCSVSSLKQQVMGRHVAPLAHIILISTSQSVFALPR